MKPVYIGPVIYAKKKKVPITANDWLPECTGNSQGAARKSTREKTELSSQFHAESNTFFLLLAARLLMWRYYDKHYSHLGTESLSQHKAI